MRVLFVSPQRLGCGEAEFGRLWARELRKVGVFVHEYDGSWPAVYARGHVYLPGDLSKFDLIHLNWGPANMGHYLPAHFPKGSPPLSLFLCDVPPNSSTALHQYADLIWATEPAERAIVVKHHLPPYQGPFVLPPPPEKPRIGITGIRKDSGTQLVRDLCTNRGWELSESQGWVSTDEEIARLASCTLNVCWYKETGRGTSMGAAYALAARRPLLLSGSSMFDYLEPWRGEYYRSAWCAEHEQLFGVQPLEGHINLILRDIQDRCDRQPTLVLRDLAWEKLAQRIKLEWEILVSRGGA